MLVWVCDREICALGRRKRRRRRRVSNLVQGKWNPSFRATGQSLRRICCGGNALVIREHEQRGRRSCRVKKQAGKPRSRSENNKSVQTIARNKKTVVRDKETTRDIWWKSKAKKKKEERWKATQRHIGGNIQPEKNEWESWFLPFLPFVSCDLFQPQGRAYPLGRPAAGIYSSVGQPANKTHVDLQRNGEGHGPENSLLFCCWTHTCMRRKNSPLHAKTVMQIHTHWLRMDVMLPHQLPLTIDR